MRVCVCWSVRVCVLRCVTDVGFSQASSQQWCGFLLSETFKILAAAQTGTQIHLFFSQDCGCKRSLSFSGSALCWSRLLGRVSWLTRSPLPQRWVPANLRCCQCGRGSHAIAPAQLQSDPCESCFFRKTNRQGVSARTFSTWQELLPWIKEKRKMTSFGFAREFKRSKI